MPSAPKKRSEAELIAYHLCCDIGDVREGRYQRYSNPAVFVVGSHYFCAPQQGKTPPEGVCDRWELMGLYYGRNVYRSAKA